MLATPVVGVITSVIVFGEPVTASLVLAMTMILGGIALGTVPGRQRRQGALPPGRLPETGRPLDTLTSCYSAKRLA